MEILEELADERLAELSLDVQVQLEKGTATRPVLWMLVEARRKAAKAIDLIIDVDPVDADSIRKIQRELCVYNDMIVAARAMLERGKEADGKIKESERSAIDEMVQGMSEEERRLYQFEPRRTDA